MAPFVSGQAGSKRSGPDSLPPHGGLPSPVSALRVGRIAIHCLASLAAHAPRTVFTILSVALGVASVTITQAVIEGANAKLEEFAEWFGADAAFVTGGDAFANPFDQRQLTLTFADAEAVRWQIPGVRMVTSGRNIRSVSVTGGGNTYVVQVLAGSTPPFTQSWNWELESGEDLSGEDSASHRKVCLIGDTVSRELFGQDSPIGATIAIGGHVFTVKGRLAARGFANAQASMDDRVIIPLSSLMRYFKLDQRFVNGLRVRFQDQTSLEEGLTALRGLIRHRHALGAGEPDDFTVVSAGEIINFLTVLKRGVGFFLAAFSAVTLAVAGIVLANLTYVAVEQRRQEIAILKAVGARRADIGVMIFTEAVLLCLAGAVAGTALCLCATFLINAGGVFTVSLSAGVWLAGLCGASAVALAFGLGPALSAAGLDPVACLHEG
jgi:putative ABC transport system permease protein